MSALTKGCLNIMDKILEGFSGEQILKLALILVLIAFVSHIAMASGLVPGVSGYAKESDVYQIRLSIANESFSKAQKQVCEMIATGNRQAATYASAKRKEFNDELIALTGREPRLPECFELGIDITHVGNRQ